MALVAKFSRSIAEGHPFAAMLKRRPIAFLCALTLIGFGVGVVSMDAPPPPLPPLEARQFDFWLGEWDVTSPDGRFQGGSKVELVAEGFGVLEHWHGDAAAGRLRGSSLNAWNPQKKRWQQFWVGGDGTVLELTGGLDASARMVLEGEQTEKGRRTLSRISWTPGADGTVRQRWEQSGDLGTTWETMFEGHYARKKAKAASGGGRHTRAMYYLFW